MDTLIVFIASAALAFMFLMLAYKIIKQVFQAEKRHCFSIANLSAAVKCYTSGNSALLSVIYVRVKLDEMADKYPNNRVNDAYTKVGCLLLDMVKSNPENVVAGIGDRNFLIVSDIGDNNFRELCERFYDELSLYGTENNIKRLPEVRFGMYIPKSAAISFEEALMNAKQTYRYAVANERKYASCSYDMLCKFEEKEQLEQYVENSIKNGGFHTMFQPYVNIKTNQIIGCEMLARLKHPVYGLVMPETFIGMIDKIELNVAFDYSIFDKCCEWIASRPEEIMNGRTVGCNFSRETLSCSDFIGRIKEIADKYGVQYSKIAIEITEHKKEDNVDIVLLNIVELHKLGFKVFLDDYGMGFSTYSDIRDYPIDMLKIDKEFLYNCNTDEGKAVFENIIELSKKLDIPVLCEGVETKEHEDYVRQVGCDVVQGFYYYIPMESHECSRLFQENIIK